MTSPTSAREALIVEALGETATLIRAVEALVPTLNHSCRMLADAQSRLAKQATALEANVETMTQRAQVRAVKHILMRTEDAARLSVDRQSRLMEDAARAAFRNELVPALRHLHAALQPLTTRTGTPWERWLTHIAAAAAAAALTWTLTVVMWVR